MPPHSAIAATVNPPGIAAVSLLGLAFAMPFVLALGRAGGDAQARSRCKDEAAWRSRIAAIMAAADDGLVVVDRAGRVREANSAACRQGGGAEQVVGRPVWQALPALRSAGMEQRCRQAVDDGEPFEATAFSTPDQRRFRVHGEPFDDGLAISFRDITDDGRAGDALRPPTQLDVLGQLTGGVAHDVNNLLTIVLGNFEMLALQAEDCEPPRLQDLDLIHAGLGAGQTASELMRRLLAFSRRTSLSPQAIDVAALFGAVQPLLRQTLGASVELRIDCPPGLWAVLVDRPGLESVLLNLALNSRDAMPGGGTFAISGANLTAGEAQRHARGVELAGDYVTITATDSGQGMSPEVLERVFEPFFTTKPQGAGTGLGLSMAHGFAKQSNGQISVESSRGEGTAVTLFLPRTGLTPKPDPPPRRAHAAPHGTATILLVEDHEQVRLHAANLLTKLGYHVIQAADGRQAVDALERGAAPDLLLTDVVMAGEYSGRDLADIAARLRPGLPVLFMSGHPGAVLAEDGRLPPGVDLLAKPFRPGELADRVAARLDSALMAAAGRSADAGLA